MITLIAKLSSVSPAPMPRQLDPEMVNPGPMLGVIFTFLLVSLIILLVSMTRHIKKINVNRDIESK